MPVRRSLTVRAERDAAEVARFWSHVVCGPLEQDCWLWTGAIGDDGYGRFWLRRAEEAFVVRPHRYALALAHGLDLGELEVGEHFVCDVPLCVRAEGDQFDHVLVSTQAENLARMGQRGRGGGPWWAYRWRGGDRAAVYARSRALRDAVRGGWDAEAVRAALDDVPPGQPTLF